MKLKRKNLSIAPTRHGVVFLFILLAMLAGSINYNNNAGFILVFLLGGMVLISLFHSHGNLSGTKVSVLPPSPVFAGQTALIPVRIRAGKKGCRSINIIDQGRAGDRKGNKDPDPFSGLAEIEPGQEETLYIKIPTNNRGMLRPAPLTLTSVYPFGLFSLKARIPITRPCLVYPAPIAGPFYTGSHTGTLWGEEEGESQGPDDFQGLAQYRPGNSIGHISWKTLSRGKGLFIKDFTADQNLVALLDYNLIPGTDTEFKLSRLSHMVLEAEKNQMDYGLILPNHITSPQTGESHKHNCLKTLALFAPGEKH